MRHRLVPAHLPLAILVLMGSTAWAQNPPKDLQPLPDIPPPPPMQGSDPSLEPQVTIIQRDDQTVEEYRIKGRVYMMKVTPKGAPPYYLLDNGGDGNFTRFDSMDKGLRPPRWILKEF